MLVALLLASCTAGPVRETTSEPPASASWAGPTDSEGSRPLRGAVSPSPPTACPVTLPNGDNPPGQNSPFSYGNGRLWVELWWPDGHIRARKDDVRPGGGFAIKVPWTRGVQGQLSITGRQLDAEAPLVRARVPDGYGSSGFQASGVIFPTPGCWEVVGRVGRVSLTFVTWVTGPVPD